jgi:proline dehydrogenase
MVSFDNTEIAFSSKTVSDLNRSYLLFKTVSNSTVVNISARLTDVALRLHIPIAWAIKPTIFKQFCGGETITECATAITQLGKFNIGTILDYSVEGKTKEADFDATMHETIATIDRAKGDKNIPFSVFKVTGISRFTLLEKVNENQTLTTIEQAEYERVQHRVNEICKRAHQNDVPVFIDAEETWIQNTIDTLANTMMECYNTQRAIVYNTYQLYRHDRLHYLTQTVNDARSKNYYVGAKLVRGAYMEKERNRAAQNNYPSPINADKNATDKLYDQCLNYWAANADVLSICAGSHNEHSAITLMQLMAQHNIANNDTRVYFSQLLGMSDHISYNLAAAGYNVAKYVPYGPVREVVPYLIRRAQENTSVKGQTGRELSLIIKEKQRRRLITN